MADSNAPAPNNTNNTPNNGPKKSGYGKRPLWQWIVLYVIIAGIVYYGIYYFFIHKASSSSNGSTPAQHSLY